MEEISLWLNEVLLVELDFFFRFLANAAREALPYSIGLGVLALLAGIVSRNVLILLAASAIAAVSLCGFALAETEIRKSILLGLGGFSLVILLLWIVSVRRHFRRQRQAVRQLVAEKDELRRLLDREIAWRRAAEDPGANASAAPPAAEPTGA